MMAEIRSRPYIILIILAVIAIAVVLTNLPDKEETVPAQSSRESVSEVDDVAAVPTAKATRVPVNDIEDVTPTPVKKITLRSANDAGRVPQRGSVDRDMSSPNELTQSASPVPVDGPHPPLMIRWSNWQPEFGSALVYAREFDLDGMLRLQEPVDKMLMVTSYAELERLMMRADELQAAGVTIVGLNTENGPQMTPHEEMETLDSPDPDVNVVARAARLATQHGFDVLWGPVRLTADNVSDASIRTMLQAGVTGLALQEQKFIEVQPAQERLAEVNRTRERYLQLAQEEAIANFTFHVQIMPQRCPDLSNCVAFVLGLEDIPIDSLAIWSNGPIPPAFIAAVRHY